MEALAHAARQGLPGGHHFYLTFRTDHPGVELPGHLRQRFPEEMTIVLQHQFWDLAVDEAAGQFRVGLSFGGVPATLVVPFAALTAFADPEVQFQLSFKPMPAEAERGPAEGGRRRRRVGGAGSGHRAGKHRSSAPGGEPRRLPPPPRAQGMTPTPRPVMLVILDGWGCREEVADNAVRQAKTPTFDGLWASAPHAFLRTSGGDVGLPEGQMGNSEVGHLNIGAGRVVMQELPRIDAAIADGSLAKAPALVSLIARLHETGGACHLMGLASPGGVHAHQRHALALANVLAEGRDFDAAACLPRRARHASHGGGRDFAPLPAESPHGASLASLSGRYFAMDRDRRWDRVEKAYLAIAEGQAPRWDRSARSTRGRAPGGDGRRVRPAGRESRT